VNVAVSPRSDRFPIHHVVEVRVDEKITISSAQGLVIQDAQGLVGLQLAHYELTSTPKGSRLSRQWSSLIARRLPDGPPSVWMDGEIEPPDLEGNPGDWYSINAFTVTATIGPFLSLSGHHTLGTGAVYFGDDWPALTFAAPDGHRVSLPDLLDSAEMASLLDRLSPPGDDSAAAAYGAHRDQFAWTFDGGEKASGLHLQAGSETASPGDRLRFERVPTGLSPHLIALASSPGRVGQPSSPGRVGHPRGCAEIELRGGALRVWPRGATGDVRIPLPAPLRSAVFLGAAWVSLDDPFTLAQLSPSGYATSKPIPGAPPVKYRVK
jgi:hypothetical protein